MKTFNDFSIDQQNDLNLFGSINYDFEIFKVYFNTLLRSTPMDDAISFHNNVVKARSIMDEIIKIINSYEDKA